MTTRLINSNRTKIRLALPSKRRMEDETREFLRECGLPVNKVNSRQYVATIAEIPNLEVWFQRSADVVRKVRDGDVDLGIVGYDNVAEYRGSGDSVVIIHGFVLGTTIHPWYLIWIVPYLAFFPNLAWMLLTGTVVLAYHAPFLTPAGEPWKEHLLFNISGRLIRNR